MFEDLESADNQEESVPEPKRTWVPMREDRHQVLRLAYKAVEDLDGGKMYTQVDGRTFWVPLCAIANDMPGVVLIKKSFRKSIVWR